MHLLDSSLKYLKQRYNETQLKILSHVSKESHLN